MGYYVDLNRISIDKYKEILKEANLIPSRMILKENIDKNLDRIKAHQFRNIAELQKALKNKSKLADFSKQFEIPERYLEVLRAEINGYLQKPNSVKDFTCLDVLTKQKLEELGLKNTLKLYDEVLNPEKRSELSLKTGINDAEILKITKLTDLSRIRWVNHTFAFVLHEAGYDTVEKVAKADAQKLYETVKQLNKEREIYKAHIGVNDMKLCIESAKGLDLEIEY